MRTFDLALPTSPTRRKSLRIDAPEDMFVPAELEKGGLASYEPETLACFLAAREIAGGGTVFDVGANVGVFSLLTAATGAGEVVAFEPAPSLAQCARDVTAANELDVLVEGIALGAENGEATFYLSAQSDCSNSLLEGFRKSDEELTVKVETLDSYCARTRRTPVLLKIDTEATEPDVLRGAHSYIREHRPWMIVEALAGRTEEALTELMKPLDYHWYQITSDIPLVERTEIQGDRAYRYNNWLFAPSKPDQAFWDKLAEWRRAIEACGDQNRRVAATKVRLAFTDRWRPNKLSKRWQPHRNASVQLSASRGRLIADVALGDKGRFYVSHSAGDYGTPPSLTDAWAVAPGNRYEIEVDIEVGPSAPSMQLWAIQYSNQARLTHDCIQLRAGANKLSFRTANSASRVRVALRFGGKGTAKLGPLRAYEFTSR